MNNKERIWMLLKEKLNIKEEYLREEYLDKALTGYPYYLPGHYLVYLLLELTTLFGEFSQEDIKNNGLYSIRNILNILEKMQKENSK